MPFIQPPQSIRAARAPSPNAVPRRQHPIFSDRVQPHFVQNLHFILLFFFHHKIA
jgi:hypothetical protein